jgi:BlaI family transcriptional regulator, penicillinase repressor
MPRKSPNRPHALPRLSRREQELMDILFQRGSATVAEVLESLADPPGYSAVRATLNILVNKGHARQEQDGPRYVYSPAVSVGTAQRAALRHLVSTFFGGSAEQAAATLLELADSRMAPEMAARLSARIAAARKEGR